MPPSYLGDLVDGLGQDLAKCLDWPQDKGPESYNVVV